MTKGIYGNNYLHNEVTLSINPHNMSVVIFAEYRSPKLDSARNPFCFSDEIN